MATPAPDVARGPVRETSIEAPCPVCAHFPLVLRSLDLDLPYFGEALQTTLLCPSCGYRHADLLLTRSCEPVRYTLHAVRPEHWSARVARSASGTIRVPELGATMEPGPRAEAFVSNAEGVLRKFLDVVQGQEATAEDAAERARYAAVREHLQRILDEQEPFTLILEDPTGNSAILHEDAVREPLSEEEASQLKSPEFSLDLSAAGPDEEE